MTLTKILMPSSKAWHDATPCDDFAKSLDECFGRGIRHLVLELFSQITSHGLVLGHSLLCLALFHP